MQCLTEDMWELGVRILNEIKDYKIKNDVPVLLEEFFQHLLGDCKWGRIIDIVYIEGENALIDLCEKFRIKKII